MFSGGSSYYWLLSVPFACLSDDRGVYRCPFSSVADFVYKKTQKTTKIVIKVSNCVCLKAGSGFSQEKLILQMSFFCFSENTYCLSPAFKETLAQYHP